MKVTTNFGFKQTELGSLPCDWRTVQFRAILSRSIRHGIYKPKESFDPRGVRILKMGDVNSFARIGDQNMERVWVTPQEVERFRVREGNLIFARTSMMTGGLGNCSMVVKTSDPIIFDGNLMCAEIDTTLADPEFYLYFFKSERGQHEIAKRATGTQSRNIPGSKLMEAYVPMLDKQEQNGIASILSDLDSKIDLNQQMNRTLEAIGQAIFQHWFINFEFPDRDGGPYNSSGGAMVYNEELGKGIPNGWSVSRIGDRLETRLGGTPSTENKAYWENGTRPWINSGKVNEFRIIEPNALITDEAVSNSATKLVPKGTTVLAITGATLGQVSRVEIDSYINQSVVGIIESNSIPSEYIYFWIKQQIQDVIRNQTGAAQQHINKANVNESLILVPSQQTIGEYKKNVKPIFDKISVTCFESRSLSQIRDSLLPKLMSGKIRVPVAVR